MPLLAHRLQEGVARGPRAAQRDLEAELQRFDQPRVPGDQAGLGEGGARVQVPPGLRHALLGRAEAVAHREADVPEQHERALHEVGQGGGGRARVQEEEVDVGGRAELAASVSAEGHHRALGQLVWPTRSAPAAAAWQTRVTTRSTW